MSFNTNTPAPNEFHMKTGQCCSDANLCCFVSCCPCFAMKEVASNIGNDNYAWAHCAATFPFNFGCCSLTILGQEVAEKRNIPMTTTESACMSFFNTCTCFSCKVLHESRLYQRQAATGAVTEWQAIGDRGGGGASAAMDNKTTEMV